MYTSRLFQVTKKPLKAIFISLSKDGILTFPMFSCQSSKVVAAHAFLPSLASLPWGTKLALLYSLLHRMIIEVRLGDSVFASVSWLWPYDSTSKCVCQQLFFDVLFAIMLTYSCRKWSNRGQSAIELNWIGILASWNSWKKIFIHVLAAFMHFSVYSTDLDFSPIYWNIYYNYTREKRMDWQEFDKRLTRTWQSGSNVNYLSFVAELHWLTLWNNRLFHAVEQLFD